MFYFLKYAAKHGHDVSLVSFDGIHESEKQTKKLKEYCKDIIVVHKPEKKIFRTLIEAFLSPRLLKDRIFPTYFYSRQMQEAIDEVLKTKSFDILYCDSTMIPFIVSASSTKVLDIVEPVLYSQNQLFLNEKKLTKKILWLSVYYQYKMFLVPTYRNFDACITVSPFHKELLESYKAPNVVNIPYGVDLSYFKGTGTTLKKPVLVFTGLMSYIQNIKGILWFYNEVYPMIKRIIPATQLYIVGNQPAKEIRELSKDSSVTVTGWVDDVRTYFNEASVVIVPIVTDDAGFKIKVLEAMSMGKPIVSTSFGAKGINVSHDKDIIIADGAREFADSVIHLLNNEPLRLSMGSNARKMVEKEYSWEMKTDELFGALRDVLKYKGKRSQLSVR